MKKILYFASALLAVFMTYACSSIEDNAAPTNIPVTIEDADGVKHEAYLIATFKGEVGTEVSLKLGVYNSEDMYFVDFGDGKMQAQKVGIDNKGPVREDGTTPTATEFKGTVAGDGIISIYGKNDLWYLYTTGNAIPTNFDQDKLKKVVQMSFTGVNVDKVELPQLDSLTQFSFNNSPVQSVDVSKCVKLTSLTINNASASKYEPQLASIDVSKNTELNYLSLQGNQNKYGKLKTLDLSNNTKLSGKGLYVQYNELEELIIGENTLTLINVSGNKLKSLDLSKFPKLKSLYASNNLFEGELDLTAFTSLEDVQVNGNKLTAVKFNNITKTFWIEDNNFTLATIPAQPAGMNSKTKTKNFHYAPQAAFAVPESVTELDLTSQLTVEKGELKPTDYAEYLSGTTAYSFVTASGTALVEGTDYEVTAPGKFKFLKAQAEKVHAVMTNDALPKFTGNNAYVTTEFTINAEGGASTSNIWSVPADYFTTPVAPDTKLFDNEFASAKTVFSATAAENKVSIAGIDFAGYIQLRVDADPTADTPTGTEKGGSTPFVITAKKDVTIKVYNRRQKGSNGYEAGDNKGLLCWDQAAAAKLSGTETFDKYEKDEKGNDNEDYGYVITSFKLSAGKTYTLYRRGSTMRIFGIAFE